MIISNSSPLIVLGRLNRLDILESLFGKVFIPNSVYQETVLETAFEKQSTSIQKAIKQEIIVVVEPSLDYTFRRKLHSGEKGVLNLSLEQKAHGIIIDDKKARNEAKELGLRASLFYTIDILRGAEKRGYISSYSEIIKLLQTMNFYLPEK